MRGRLWMLGLCVALGVAAALSTAALSTAALGTGAASATAPLGDFEVVDTTIVQRAIKVEISPNGRYLYVLQATATTPSFLPGQLEVLDAQTLEHVTTVDLSTPTRATPADMALSPDGGTLYIALCSRFGGTIYNTDYLLAVDTATYAVILEEPFGSSWSLSNLVAHPDGQRVYLTFRNDRNLVRVYDVVSGTIKASLAVGNDPMGIDVTPDGSRVYTVKRNTSDVAVIDTTSDTLLTTLPLGTPAGGSDTQVTITPDGRKAYAVNESYNTGSAWVGQPWISVINTNPLDADFHTVEVITTTGSRFSDLSVSADGRYLYASSRDTDEVLILDTATDTVRQQLMVAEDPTGVVASTRWGEFYVASFASNTVSRVEMVKARLYLPLVLRNKS